MPIAYHAIREFGIAFPFRHVIVRTDVWDYIPNYDFGQEESKCLGGG